MKYFRLILALGLSVAFNTYAAEAPTDPYNPSYTMPGGPLRGQLIDTSERRPVIVLPPETAKLYGAREGEMVIANFSSGNQHWIAKIPDRYLAIIPQIDHFPPDGSPIRAGHTMFRVMAEKGHEILLYPQTLPPKSASELPAPKKLTEMHLTADAVGPKGWKFSAEAGLKGKLAVVLRAVDSADMADTKVTKLNRNVTQFVAMLPDEVKNRYPQAFFELSQQWKLSKMYHLVFRNCDNVQMCVIDDLTKDPSKSNLTPLSKIITDINPLQTEESFRQRKIVTIPLEDWDQEIKEKRSVRSQVEALMRRAAPESFDVKH